MGDAAQKRTPLYQEHVRLGAKMIPFGDWLMPVQYTGIVDEHQTVRKNVGIFDISHMGQLIAEGVGGWSVAERDADQQHRQTQCRRRAIHFPA